MDMIAVLVSYVDKTIGNFCNVSLYDAPSECNIIILDSNVKNNIQNSWVYKNPQGLIAVPGNIFRSNVQCYNKANLRRLTANLRNDLVRRIKKSNTNGAFEIVPLEWHEYKPNDTDYANMVKFLGASGPSKNFHSNFISHALFVCFIEDTMVLSMKLLNLFEQVNTDDFKYRMLYTTDTKQINSPGKAGVIEIHFNVNLKEIL